MGGQYFHPDPGTGKCRFPRATTRRLELWSGDREMEELRVLTPVGTVDNGDDAF
jgi:hypothetical protein